MGSYEFTDFCPSVVEVIHTEYIQYQSAYGRLVSEQTRTLETRKVSALTKKKLPLHSFVSIKDSESGSLRNVVTPSRNKNRWKELAYSSILMCKGFAV